MLFAGTHCPHAALQHPGTNLRPTARRQDVLTRGIARRQPSADQPTRSGARETECLRRQAYHALLVGAAPKLLETRTHG
jgi:hypothetical protein